jgi:hypothetical protein
MGWTEWWLVPQATSAVAAVPRLRTVLDRLAELVFGGDDDDSCILDGLDGQVHLHRHRPCPSNVVLLQRYAAVSGIWCPRHLPSPWVQLVSVAA